MATFNHKAASLSCCFQNDDIGYGGGLDQMIHMLDLHRGTSRALFAHDAAISCMKWSNTCQALFTGNSDSALYTINQCMVYFTNPTPVITGSWDATIAVHDSRKQENAEKIPLPGKAYSLSLNADKLVVATSDRHILVYDIRNMSGGPIETCESPLKYQTRVVSCFLDGSAYAIGSVEVYIFGTMSLS